MFYSYVMGVSDSIHTLEAQGFIVGADGDNYTVSFPPEKADIWENFITSHLELGYWNEYLTDFGVVFLFHLENGIKRYEVNDFENDEVLVICEKLCECKIESLKTMLSENQFYKNLIK